MHILTKISNCKLYHYVRPFASFLGVILDVAEVNNKIENVKKPDVDLEDKTIPVIAVSDNVHCPNIPPNATKYIGEWDDLQLCSGSARQATAILL